MLQNKRQFKRFDLPLIVKFRQTDAKNQYSLGLLKNISCDGLSLEAREFNFIQNENLELELKFPQGNTSVSLLGDVMWKRRDGNICYAGVKFLAQSEEIQNEIMDKISSHANIPLDIFLNHKMIGHKGNEKEVLPRPAIQKSKAPLKPLRSSLIKEYLEDRSQCRVIFILPKEAAPDARQVTIAGDFNDWDVSGTSLIKLKNGDFSVPLVLDSGREYKFKYLIDGSRWENDWFADKYIPNSFGSDDSVVIT
jgi:hypothetical protein